jgi:uncharacterized tellurite resistance protein B-like protein
LLGGLPSEQSEAHTPEAILEATRSRILPFAEVMFLVMCADGRSDAAERRTLTAALGVLCEGRLSESDLTGMIAEFSRREGDPETRIARLGATLARERSDREMAFTLAATIALADEEVADGERSVLDMVAEYFGISDARANELLAGQ